jgi:hypothetical protein
MIKKNGHAEKTRMAVVLQGLWPVERAYSTAKVESSTGSEAEL